MQILPQNPWLKTGFITLIVIIVLFLIAVLYGVARSYQANKHPDNTRFTNGTYPSTDLNGTYSGSWGENDTTWQGKEFFAGTNSGINNFVDGQRYRFKTYRGKSISTGKEVLKIDYNQPGNPFWVRRIVDELVEVEPGKYQGKVYARVLPRITFTLTYFTLQQ